MIPTLVLLTGGSIMTFFVLVSESKPISYDITNKTVSYSKVGMYSFFLQISIDVLKNIFLLTLDEIEEKVISLTKGQFVCKSKFNPDLKMKKNENCASKVFT